jgi:hypothetical protein
MLNYNSARLLILATVLAACDSKVKTNIQDGIGSKTSGDQELKLEGFPSGESSATLIMGKIVADNVKAFRYKLGNEPVNCAEDKGYLDLDNESFFQDITDLEDGAVRLCVIGFFTKTKSSSEGAWLPFEKAASVTWTKVSKTLIAAITGSPAGTSSLTSVSLMISGTDVVKYRTKVGSLSSTDCASSTGYASEKNVGTAATLDLSAIADGEVIVCVIGANDKGRWQKLDKATTVGWTKDTTPPTATLAGYPTGADAATTITATVAGTDVATYRYKIGPSSSTICTASADYSSSTPVATGISASILLYADGPITLCALGSDNSGNEQSLADATEVDWIKNASGVTATISGVPTGTNNTTTLAVTVGAVSSYMYKVGVSSSTDCSAAAGYSSDTNIATLITASVAGLSDGTIKLCVVGQNAFGVWQAYGSATSATWTKDTTAPTATISGTPTGTNNATTLAITVAGTDVTHYQYKVGLSGSIDCTAAAGYSAEAAISTNITNDISGIADGAMKLCVIGRDSAGNYQALTSATSATWTKDTAAPTASLSGVFTGLSKTTTLAVTVSGTDVTHYAFKVGASGTTDCAISSGYSSSTAIATNITSSISGISDGEIKLCVVGIDSVGNQQAFASATSATWYKDTTAPTYSSASITPTQNVVDVDLVIAGTSDNQSAMDASAAITYTIYRKAPSTFADAASPSTDGTALTASTNTSQTNTSVGNGTYYYTFCASDAAGNSSCSGAISSITLDYTAPVVTNVTVTRANPSLNWTLAWTMSDNISATGSLSVSITRAGVAFHSASGINSYTAITGPSGGDPAILQYVLRIQDAAGNYTDVDFAVTATEAVYLQDVRRSSGLTAGGQFLLVVGGGFSSGTATTIGGTTCTAIGVWGTMRLGCTTPTHTAGAKDVVVTRSDMAYASLPKSFTYAATSSHICDGAQPGSGFATGDGSAGSPYQICTGAQLNRVRNNNTGTVYFKMMDNIDLTSYGLNGFAMTDMSGMTAGEFDGNGFAIYNFRVNSTICSTQYCGFFSRVANFGVKNLSLVAASVTSSSNYVGGLIGERTGSATTTDLYVTGTVTGATYTGGIIGSTSAWTSSNLVTFVTVAGAEYSGGIVGLSSQPFILTDSGSYGPSVTSSSYRVGGVVGNAGNTSLTRVYSKTAVTSTFGAHAYAGGLMGVGNGTTSITDSWYASTTGVQCAARGCGGLIAVPAGNLTITNSYSTAPVAGAGDYVGGLVGFNYNAGGSTTFINSSSSGTIKKTTSGSYVGGLLGFGQGDITITSSYFSGLVLNTTGSITVYSTGGLIGAASNASTTNASTTSITDSYVSGAVSGWSTASGAQYGGFIGETNHATTTITNSYFSGSYVRGATNTGGIIGLATTGSNNSAHTTVTLTGVKVLATTTDIGGAVNVGGLIGGTSWNNTYYPTLIISKSYVLATTVRGNTSVGGIIGLRVGSGSVRDVFATSTISGLTGASSSHGGIVGNDQWGRTYTRAYFAGVMTTTNKTNYGGLGGYSHASTTFTDCFWDTTVSGVANANGTGGVGGTGKTTAQMQAQATFTNYDFATVWQISAGAYPTLIGY